MTWLEYFTRFQLGLFVVTVLVIFGIGLYRRIKKHSEPFRAALKQAWTSMIR